MADKIKLAIESLSPELLEKHQEAIVEGFEDKVCSKCGVVYLAHHHFVSCLLAHCGECPMVSKGAKTLLRRLLGSKVSVVLDEPKGE